MPSVAVKLYSVFFKFLLKHRLQNRIQTQPDESNPFGVTSRPEETIAAVNPLFEDGIATKDIHIDPFTSLSIRIFLPESALNPPETDSKASQRSRVRASYKRSDLDPGSPQVDAAHQSQGGPPHLSSRRNSYGNSGVPALGDSKGELRRNSYGCSNDVESLNLISSGGGGGVYRGYSPSNENSRRLPVILQFHGGGWVSGSSDSVANDFFCRRIAKLCDVIVLAIGYRLAPENRYPAAFDDGLKVLNWLGKQANLAECSKSMGNVRSSAGGGTEFKKTDVHRHIVDTFGASMVEPWLAAHGDPSRFAKFLSFYYFRFCRFLNSSCI